MNNIKWEDGAVCYAGGEQWDADNNLEDALTFADFQLNEIREGDFVPASELDTEQKFNNAVAVFGLFGFKVCDEGNDFNWFVSVGAFKIADLVLTDRKIMGSKGVDSVFQHSRKITYSQLMAIGKLKRAMNEREKSAPKTAPDLTPDIPQNEKRNKSKQAYEILKSLDYDYDLVKQKWFKKHYI